MIKMIKGLVLFIFILVLFSGCGNRTHQQILQSYNIQLESYWSMDLSFVHSRLYPDYKIIEIKVSTDKKEMTNLAKEIGADLVLKSILDVYGGGTYLTGYKTEASLGGTSITPSYSNIRATIKAEYYFLKRNPEYRGEVIELSLDKLEKIILDTDIYSTINLDDTLLLSSSYRLGYDDKYIYFFESNYSGELKSSNPIIKIEKATKQGIGIKEYRRLDNEMLPVSIYETTLYHADDVREKRAYYIQKDRASGVSRIYFRVRPNGRKAMDTKLSIKAVEASYFSL